MTTTTPTTTTTIATPRLDALAAPLLRHPGGDTPVDEVLAVVHALAQSVADTETLPLAEALDRVLAEPLPSPVDVPPHDNAAMDGYAFDGAALQPGRAMRLRCVGKVLAGDVWTTPIAPGDALRIMTGAALPGGLDTVVPHERVQAHADGTVDVPADAVRPGANRRSAGEDLQRGQTALPQGQRLGPAALGLAASLGLAQLRVWRRVRVAYFSTGDELLAPGQPSRPGAIYDSNRFSITALLRRLGAEVMDLGAVPDDPARLRQAFMDAAAQADIVLSSGGASAGDADHTRQLLQALCRDSGGVAFWQVAMRPGRPLVIGQLGRRDQRAPRPPLRPARQPGRCHGQLPALRAARTAAHGRLPGHGPATATARPPGPCHSHQAPWPHRVPARHRATRCRWLARRGHHRPPGLRHPALHGRGAGPHRVAPCVRPAAGGRCCRRDALRRPDLNNGKNTPPWPTPSSGTTTRPSAACRAATGLRSLPACAPTPN
jgi:molybdopterin molybdotransferase